MQRFVIFTVLLCCSLTTCSRVTIESNGYRNVLVALPRDAKEEEWPRIVKSVEDMLRSSSIHLQMSTKGRAYFSEISFLVPENWKLSEDDQDWKLTSFNSTNLSAPRAALTADEADVHVTEKGQHPFVLHQAGCGRQAMRIILPKDFVLRSENTGVEFARLWSEYRYGVFPEGGFQDDEKFPARYKSPDGKEERITGCSDATFWSSSLCAESERKCRENSFTSSLMDQHLSSSASLFCEGYMSLGPKHNIESPSKQNLLCEEEGTWFTVMRSADFAHGKNAAPKHLPVAADVSFRFVREAASPRVVVAIEISSKMLLENRYILTQAAFYHFVYSTLPYGSEVTLFVFGDENGVQIAKEATVLKYEDSRIHYVETQPLPDEASDTNNDSLADLFGEILLTNTGADVLEAASPDVIVVTTESSIDAFTYSKLKRRLSEAEGRLHVLLFPENGNKPLTGDGSLLMDLCHESGGEFISLQNDALENLYRGFGRTIRNFNKDIPIVMDYLDEDTDADLEVSFVVDEELAENLKVYLFFPFSDVRRLQYAKTVLQTPSGTTLRFMKLEFLFAWAIDLTDPEAGKYILKTRRVEDVTLPVLMSVTFRSPPEDEPITVNVWAEAQTDVQVSPQPIRVYAEVRKGWSPVRGARVMASVVHPQGQTSELTLLDDGIGDVDITRDDGIYGRYFTNFSVPGYYNIIVKVFHGINKTEIVRGPTSFCCGSFFPAVSLQVVGPFRRESGPVTFQVLDFEESPEMADRYRPSRITDLTLYSRYDRICILHWTAVGDDYDSGFIETYELKVFRDSSAIRNRFSGSSQELHSEAIAAPPEAVYGTTLNHAFELPSNMSEGVYYIAIRAVDDVGNVGQPSNAVPVWVEEIAARTFDCGIQDEGCQDDQCEDMHVAEKLQQGNAAESMFSGVVTIFFIPTNVFVPIFSLLVSLLILNTL